MGLTVSSGGGDYENLAPGRYKASCYKIVDMGSRMESFQGQPEKKRATVYIYWEVTHMQMGNDGEEFWDDIAMTDGRPFSIGKKYTASLNENSTLHRDLKSWRGKPFTAIELAGFNIENVLGVSCELEVVPYKTQDGSERTKLEGVYKPDGGAKRVSTYNKQVIFDIDVYCEEFTGQSSEESKAMCDVLEACAPWMKEEIDNSLEVKAAQEKGGRSAPPPASQGGGLSDFKKDDDDDEPEPEEEIPF